MRTTIAAKLYFSFGLMAALIVGSATFTLYNTTQARQNYQSLYQNTHGAVLLADAQNALWQLRYGFPQFMVGRCRSPGYDRRRRIQMVQTDQ